MPIALVRSWAGKACSTSAEEFALVAPDASPASTRITRKLQPLHAAALSRVSTIVVKSTIRYMRRWPSRSPSLPPMAPPTAEPSTPPVTAHAIRVGVLSSSFAISAVARAMIVRLAPLDTWPSSSERMSCQR